MRVATADPSRLIKHLVQTISIDPVVLTDSGWNITVAKVGAFRQDNLVLSRSSRGSLRIAVVDLNELFTSLSDFLL